MLAVLTSISALPLFAARSSNTFPVVRLNFPRQTDNPMCDISKLGSNAAKGDSSAQSASAEGNGEGPGGAHLYRAEWYVEPSHGQLAFYLPKRIDSGSWAEIACKTVAAYHVENCVLLGESPVGSGLARAIRSASWQFLIRPPRIEGKPLVGTWVRIHIEFSADAKD